MLIDELPTPALLVDRPTLERNIATMSERWPGVSLRPHVKAFKSTALARRLVSSGHRAFCCATPAEIVGLSAAGLGDDLLLANETLDDRRLRAMADADALVTVAVDSPETVDAAAAGGIGHVVVDVNVGLPRCGCPPADAPALADRARAAGLVVRGVMGYEGQATAEPDRDRRAEIVAEAMAVLTAVHDRVGGEVVSGGATLTWDCNHWVTELQAGSYLLMDTHFAPAVPFGLALSVLATVISANPSGYAVCDAGLKAFGMDHGPPTIPGHAVWFCSDEHTTFATTVHRPGDRVRLLPAHVDPTVAQHGTLWVVDGDTVVDEWPVDLRGW